MSIDLVDFVWMFLLTTPHEVEFSIYVVVLGYVCTVYYKVCVPELHILN